MRVPAGLCNALVVFQRWMMLNFLDMVEETLDMFMDDFPSVDDTL